jgi:DNA-binding CsgD family transcriptional regulator
MTDSQKLNQLTPREAEIAMLIHEGKRVSEVARALNINTNTVRAHQNNIYKRLGIHTIRELVLLVERAK